MGATSRSVTSSVFFVAWNLWVYVVLYVAIDRPGYHQLSLLRSWPAAHAWIGTRPPLANFARQRSLFIGGVNSRRASRLALR